MIWNNENIKVKDSFLYDCKVLSILQYSRFVSEKLGFAVKLMLRKFINTVASTFSIDVFHFLTNLNELLLFQLKIT